MAKAVTATTGSTNNNSKTLGDLPFTLAVKTRGSASATGGSATYNAKTRRLTIGSYYYTTLGYRSAATGIVDGKIALLLRKEGYDATYGSIHPSQYFTTVIKTSAAIPLLAKSRKYDIVADADRADLFYLVARKNG